MTPPRLTRCFVLLLASACGGDDDAPAGVADTTGATTDATTDSGVEGSTTGDESAAVAYYEHIKPLVDGRCVACHTQGGIAPFPLTTYDETVAWAGASSLAIHAGTMPPWPPAAGCNEYVGARDLDEDARALFDRWVADGTPMGDPAREGPPLADDDAGLTRVDLTLAMPEAYAPTAIPDDYRCFMLDWPAEHTTTKYVAGFRALPGNSAIVHHVIAYLVLPDQVAEYVALDEGEPGPGYTCFGGTGGPSRTWLGAWAPGGAGADLPPGLGLEVPPGSQVVLQVHYNSTASDPAPDLTAVEFKLEDSVEKIARVLPFASPAWLIGQGMMIPAGGDDVVHEFQRDIATPLGGPQNVWAAALHMHTRGASAELTVERADGDSDCMLQIDDWDFHWQGTYGLREPMRLESGDELRLQCRFDNSAANQPVVDGVPVPPKDIGWGEGTDDEMCLGVMLVAPA